MYSRLIYMCSTVMYSYYEVQYRYIAITVLRVADVYFTVLASCDAE